MRLTNVYIYAKEGTCRYKIWRNKCTRVLGATCVTSVMTNAIETRAERAIIIKRLLGTTEMRTLRCITSNTLWDRLLRSICEIQDVIRWAGISRVWRDEDGWMDNRLAKIAKSGKPKHSQIIWMVCQRLVQKWSINITGQVHWTK